MRFAVTYLRRHHSLAIVTRVITTWAIVIGAIVTWGLIGRFRKLLWARSVKNPQLVLGCLTAELGAQDQSQPHDFFLHSVVFPSLESPENVFFH
jgi:hypothetical protein